jgi:hypothetical protein
VSVCACADGWVNVYAFHNLYFCTTWLIFSQFLNEMNTDWPSPETFMFH